MIVRLLALAAVVAAMIGLPVAPARADCTYVESTHYVGGSVVNTLTRVCDRGGDGGTADGGGSSPAAPVVDTDLGTLACQAASNFMPGSAEFCLPDPEPAAPTVLMIASAFRRVALPPSTLVVQPSDGRTLVNFATNFYTEPTGFTRTLTLLGRQVQLRVTPASWTWRFGDGESRTTTNPGAAYPDLRVTHRYLTAGGRQAGVDTTYTAEFRVGGGAWAPVPGSVTIAGATEPLEVVEARPTLAAYR